MAILGCKLPFQLNQNNTDGHKETTCLEITTTQTQHKVKGGFLLDVIISQSSPILQLLSGEDKSLLIRWNPPPELHLI